MADEPFDAWQARIEGLVVSRKSATSRDHRKPKPVELTAEQAFAQAWESDPLPGVEIKREFVFHPERKWRFDFAWPAVKLAAELDGWGQGGHAGRHHTFLGARGDCEKYTAAALHGWRVMRFMSADKKHVQDWLRTVKMALCGMTDEDP
jgi:very-short-patch-repair endonuclease